MSIFKKTLSVIMSIVLLGASAGICVSAKNTSSGVLNIMSYNVSGIPLFGDTQGSQRELRGKDRMAKIGEILSAKSGCDIIGVQEDFDLHDSLAQAMPKYPYQTLSSGGLTLGDGINLFSKSPIYNIKRTEWDKAYGVISGSADRLANKGILSTVIEIESGVYIDFYVIHADAGLDYKSVDARNDNYRQLAEMINANSGHAAIIIGDFNFKYERNLGEKFNEILVQGAGLTDVWSLIYNNNDCTYDNGKDWNPTYKDSLDRVMFKNGDGIKFTPKSFEYIQFTNDKGETYTDHIATKASISYSVNGQTYKPSQITTQEPINKFVRFFETVKSVFDKIILIFTNLDEVFYLIGQGFDLLIDAIIK